MMTEIDWLRKLYQERRIGQLTLNALWDWLEERGDKRLEGMKNVRIPEAEGNNIFWKIVCPDKKIRRYDNFKTANYRLCQEIIEHFLRTHP